MSDLFLLFAIALINALSIALAYNLGTRRTDPLNLRSVFRSLTEKRTSITSPSARASTLHNLSSLTK